MLSRRNVLSLGVGAAAAAPLAWWGAPRAEATTVVVSGFRIASPIYELWLPNRTIVGSPTTNAYAITGGTKQKFTGALMYTSAKGASILRGKLRTTFGNGGGVAALGIPVGVQARNAAYATYAQRCTAGRLWWSSADGGKAVPNAKTVRLRGARNFRDAAGNGAGLAVAGGRMRRRVLYRSNKLSGLSTMDCAILLDLNVGHIIDLRRPSVIAGAPDRSISPITWENIDVFGSTTSTDALDMYRDFATSSYRRSKIAQAIRTIADSTAPVVVHCTYGKDRTGWVVAMIQLALGASETAVMAEWLKSNSYLGSTTLTTSQLTAGLKAAKRAYGSIEGYLTEGLGLDPDVRARLRARLVA